MVDLHIHSSFSTIAKDTYMLRQLVRQEEIVPTSSSISEKGPLEEMLRQAAENKLRTVSFTDHWSLQAGTALRRRASSFGVDLVPGIEVAGSLAFKGKWFETHLLGYCCSAGDPGLQKLCAEAEETCSLGAAAFREGLSLLGIEPAGNTPLSGTAGPPSGWDLRRMLVREGFARDKYEATRLQQRAVREALKNSSDYGKLRKGGVVSVEKLISVLKNAGAAVFFAHPFWLTRAAQGGHSPETVWKQIEAVLSLGADGIEVDSPANTEEQRGELLQYCREHQIPACGGSDSHNPAGLFQAAGVPSKVWESIRRYRAGLQPWAG